MSEKKVLSMKEMLLATKGQLKTKPVEVPGVGTFIVSEMMTTVHDMYEASLVKINPETKKGEFQRENMRAKLVACCLVDEKGNLMFPGEEGIAELGAMPKQVISILYDASADINGMNEEAIEDAAKN